MRGGDFKVVVPARYASTRLPGKPLLPICGRPMIEHVWRRACESGAREVVVATDDQRILDAVRAFGGDAQLTSPDHSSGTDRLAEVARARGWSEQTIVVNLQGDEPLLPGRLLASVAGSLVEHPEAGIATLATPIAQPAQLFDANAVKVVLDQRGFALYFSRAPIPWLRGQFALGRLPEALPQGGGWLRHVGLYGYRVGALSQLARAPLAPLEAAESLEQLRALWCGIRIRVEISTEALAPGVDTPEDLRAVEALMAAAGLA